MKKLFSLLIIGTLFLTGCSSAPPTHRRETNVVVSRESSSVEVTAVTTLNNVQISIKNLTDDVVEVDWNASSIAGTNIFMDNQRYADAGKIQVPSSAIAPYTAITRGVSPSNLVYYDSSNSGSWRQRNIQYPTNLVLKIIKNEKSEFVVLNINSVMVPITQ